MRPRKRVTSFAVPSRSADFTPSSVAMAFKAMTRRRRSPFAATGIAGGAEAADANHRNRGTTESKDPPSTKIGPRPVGNLRNKRLSCPCLRALRGYFAPFGPLLFYNCPNGDPGILVGFEVIFFNTLARILPRADSGGVLYTNFRILPARYAVLRFIRNRPEDVSEWGSPSEAPQHTKIFN